MYNIIRFYFRGGRRIIKRNVTLAEAQEHCKHPDTSSKTCTTKAGMRRTALMGDWFDGYEEIKGKAVKPYNP